MGSGSAPEAPEGVSGHPKGWIQNIQGVSVGALHPARLGAFCQQLTRLLCCQQGLVLSSLEHEYAIMSGAEANARPVKPVISAYSFFQSDQYSNHKDDFVELAFGQAGTEISSRWRALDDADRAKYEVLAAADRKRHDLECEARDAEVAARQAANREARFADPASHSYMRERAAVEPKKVRKVTKEEDMSEERLEARRLLKEKRGAQKAARLAAEAESSRQKDGIAAAAAAMARKRCGVMALARGPTVWAVGAMGEGVRTTCMTVL